MENLATLGIIASSLLFLGALWFWYDDVFGIKFRWAARRLPQTVDALGLGPVESRLDPARAKKVRSIGFYGGRYRGRDVYVHVAEPTPYVSFALRSEAAEAELPRASADRFRRRWRPRLRSLRIRNGELSATLQYGFAPMLMPSSLPRLLDELSLLADDVEQSHALAAVS